MGWQQQAITLMVLVGVSNVFAHGGEAVGQTSTGNLWKQLGTQSLSPIVRQPTETLTDSRQQKELQDNHSSQQVPQERNSFRRLQQASAPPVSNSAWVAQARAIAERFSDKQTLTDQEKQNLLDQYIGLYQTVKNTTFKTIDCSLPLSTTNQGSLTVGYNPAMPVKTPSGWLIKNCHRIYNQPGQLPDFTLWTDSSAIISDWIFFNNTNLDILVAANNSKLTILDSVFLSNTAVNAIVDILPGSTLESATGVIFQDNSKLPIANLGQFSAGPCIFNQPGGCIVNITSSTFVNNGLTKPVTGVLPVDVGSSVYIQGNQGATIACPNPVFMDDNHFINNAAVSGGAVFMSQQEDVTISNSNFQGNSACGQFSKPPANGALTSAGVGGAAMVQLVTAITSWNNTWVDNTACADGGAFYLAGSAKTTVHLDTYTTNTANQLTGKGGAIAMYTGSDSNLTALTFVSNAASSGGAMFMFDGGEYEIQGSTFTSNKAAHLAGAVYSSAISTIQLIGSTLTGNTATTGGAAVLLANTGVNVVGSTFTNNAAALNVNGSATGCSLDTPGAAGGLCVQGSQAASVTNAGQPWVYIINSKFNGNQATSGGAMLYTTDCLDDKACPTVLFNGSTFSNNMAVGGTGGSVWALKDNYLTCANGQTTTSGCIVPGVTAAAAGLSTSASQLVFAPTKAATYVLTNYLSSGTAPQALGVTLEVLDQFGNPVSNATSESEPSVLATLIPKNDGAIAGLYGAAKVVGTYGQASFDKLQLRAVPGNYSIQFEATNLLGGSQMATLDVTVRPCRLGEVRNFDFTECNPCRDATQFSFDPTNEDCDACPPWGNCSYPGKATDILPIGAVLVPIPGYWHSNPHSPQIHKCPYASSCGGQPGMDSRLMMMEFQKQMVGPNPPTNISDYLQLQCQEGHYGNLCAGCADGYGRLQEGQCVKCPPNAVNVLYYILSAAIRVLLIGLTVSSQLQAVRALDEDLEMAAELNALENAQPRSNTTVAPPDLKAVDNPWLAPPHVTARAYDSPGGSNSSSSDGGPLRSTYSGMLPDGRGHPRAIGEGLEGMQQPEHHTVVMGSVSPFQMDNEPRKGALAAGGMTRAFKSMAAFQAVDRCMFPDSTAIKIFVNYLQIISILRGVTLEWPTAVLNLLNVSQHISSGVSSWVSADCSLHEGTVPRSIQSVVLSVVVPVFVIILAVPFWSACWLAGIYRGLRQFKHIHHYLYNRMAVTSIAVIFFWFPSLTQSVLGIFSCKELDQENLQYSENAAALGRYWTQDYNVKCYEGQHLYLTVALGVPGLILICLGIPCLSALFLYRNRAWLQDPEFVSKYALMYADYKEEWYWWESIVMLRKVLLVLVVVFIDPVSTNLQLLAALGIIITAMFAAILCAPFRIERLGGLDRLSHWGNAFIVYLVLYFFTDITTARFRQTVTVVLVTTTVFILLYMALQIGREYVWTLMRELDADKDGVLSKADMQYHHELLARGRAAKKGIMYRLEVRSMSLFLNWVSARQHKRWATYMILFPTEYLGAHCSRQPTPLPLSIEPLVSEPVKTRPSRPAMQGPQGSPGKTSKKSEQRQANQGMDAMLHSVSLMRGIPPHFEQYK